MDKVCLVTGGAGGIGEAVCQKLSSQGYKIALCYKNSKEKAEEICKEIIERGNFCEVFYCDVGKDEIVRECVTQVKQKFGGIDILVNNAGAAGVGLFTDLSDMQLTEIININLLGAMRMSKAVLPDMIRQKKGCIINISSVWGEKGGSCEAAYSAAKAGLIGFTKALAREDAPSGVRINCISCGIINTKMNAQLTKEDIENIKQEIPAGRIGEPEDVAQLVSFLASEKSSYIQGQVIRCDGCWI